MCLIILNQLQFLIPWPPLYLTFSFQRRASGFATFNVQNFNNSVGSRIVTAHTFFVLVKPTGDVRRNPGIDASVFAFKQIYKVHLFFIQTAMRANF